MWHEESRRVWAGRAVARLADEEGFAPLRRPRAVQERLDALRRAEERFATVTRLGVTCESPGVRGGLYSARWL